MATAMLGLRSAPIILYLLLAFAPCQSQNPPYALRLSCGAQEDVHTPPNNTLWSKDYGYTGGFSANATVTSFITPKLSTLRYFPSSQGPENCYILTGLPAGHYSVRIFFGLVNDPNFDDEPLFDISVEGTLVNSLSEGWSTLDNEQVFTEALVFLSGGESSICFHNTGHGDPSVLAIEMLQIDDKAYYSGPQLGRGVILKTVQRLNCGGEQSKFDADYAGNLTWGGDRYWYALNTFGLSGDQIISVQGSINKSSVAPNFYPADLYKTALVSTDREIDLQYTVDVEPNANYSIWLHFAEIDPSITAAGQRVFDILINGDVAYKSVDIVAMSGGSMTALVLNTSVSVNGRSLTISLHPISGSHALVSAIEIFQVIAVEAKTSPDEITALQSVKTSLQLPRRLGWNGDPCVPQQHPWSGADCQFDGVKGVWYIDGLGLDNQALRGYLPEDISRLSHLQNINLSGNSIHGAIPPSLGSITELQTLDLAYNSLNGSIPESLGGLVSLRILNLNSNQLSGRVPSSLESRLLQRASFNFTGNDGLCGIPGLQTCGPHLSAGAKVVVAFAGFMCLLLAVVCTIIWCKRRQNILRAQRIAGKEAPYAKRRTHFSRDVQMTIHPRTASENGPSLLT